MSGGLGTRLSPLAQDEIRNDMKKLVLPILEIEKLANKEHAKYLIAERNAAEAIQKAKVLQNMYDEESRCKREIEISLAKEKIEHEYLKRLFEVCKKVLDNAIDTLAKEKEEHERVFEIWKQEIERLKEERSNAFRMTEDILKNQEESLLSSLKIDGRDERRPPSCFVCPISKEVMEDPHIAADGFTYEKEYISRWLSSGHSTSPMTNLRLSHYVLTPNLTLRSGIQEWRHQL